MAGSTINRHGNCSHYYDGSPSVWELTHDFPPEFWYLAGIGIGCALIVHWLWVHEIRKHRVWGTKNLHLKNKTNFLLSLYPIFSFTSLFGLFYVRASVFLEFIHNVYEGFCCLIFLTSMMTHLDILGFQWDGTMDVYIATPPVFCLFRQCMPLVKNTARFKHILHRMITQLVFVQAIIEMLRVLYTFECSYDPTSSKVVIWDTISILSFLIGAWAIVITLRLGHVIPTGTLRQFKYIKKFFGIKVLIFISKTLFKLLDLLAQKGYIKGAGGFGAEQRVRLWGNFITIVVTCLTIAFVRKLYTPADYVQARNSGESTDTERLGELVDNEHDMGANGELGGAHSINNANDVITDDDVNLISS